MADSPRKPPTKGFSTMAAAPIDRTAFKGASVRKLSVSIVAAGGESGKNSSKLRRSPISRNIPVASDTQAVVQMPD